jgi:hypothetical protein
MIPAIYVLLSLLVGWLGRHRQIGFVGFTGLSLVFTPVLILLVLMMTHESRPRPSA